MPIAAKAPSPLRDPAPRRSRSWELGDSLHCSIIGTCLSTDELRRILRKLGLGAPDASDHALHGIAVGLAGRHDKAGKVLNKALDERHRLAIRRFEPATDTAELRAAWRDAVEAGDIPGAYWAVLTHPAADRKLVNEVFGEVHMLSHLVGAANRADIRRLADQEKEVAKLRETVARQQARLRDDITERDGRIRTLQEMLAARASDATGPIVADATAELELLVTSLRMRLAREAARREAAEERLAAAEASREDLAAGHAALEREIGQLRSEIVAAEAAFAEPPSAAVGQGGAIVLYVGGRSGQTAALRRAAAQAGAELLHHDAEAGSSLLPGLVGRADLVVFPVDCVSHDAALAVKRLCRQVGRPFQPLRSTGATSLIAALREAPARG